MTPAGLIAETQRISAELDVALRLYKDRNIEAAEAERNRAREFSEAYVRSTEASNAAREREAERATLDLAFDADLKERMVRVAREALETKRSQLSACQSSANLMRAEAELAR